MENRTLLVDDDPEFCNLLTGLIPTQSLKILPVHSIGQAKQAIKNQNFDSFIIDGYLPDGSGVDLVGWIRRRKGRKPPIVFVSSRYRDAKHYYHLREIVHVDFIINKPVDRSNLSKIFEALTKNTDPDSSGEDEILKELIEEYRQSIYVKLDTLEKLIFQILVQNHEPSRKQLRMEVHKIAGTAGSYGYKAVSEICQKFETYLNEQNKTDMIEQKYEIVLKDFLTNIKINFQTPSRLSTHGVESDTQGKLSANFDLFFISNDAFLLHALIGKGYLRGLLVEGQADPKAALQMLDQNKIDTKLFLVDNDISSDEFSAYDLIQAFRGNRRNDTANVGILSSKAGMNERMQAQRNNVNFFIQKPIAVEQIIGLCESIEMMRLKLPFRVLVVDDDIQFCEFLEKLIVQIEMEVEVLYTGEHLLECLEEFNPHVLLLDLSLPGWDGLKLLRVLRADIRFRNLIILILTVQEDAVTIQESYAVGVDDYILKPVIKEAFQAKLSGVRKRHQLLTVTQSKDSLTGLLNRWAFMQEFNAFAFQLPAAQSKKLVLAIIDLDHFRKINDVYGYRIGDEILIYFSHLLSQSFWQNDLLGRWGGEEFIVLLNDFDPIHALFYLGMLLETVRNEFVIENRSNIKITFSCGITDLPNSNITLDEMLPVAQQALELAREAGRDRIRTAPGMKLPVVWLAISDPNILGMLQYAYETRGFVLHCASDFMELHGRLGGVAGATAPDLVVLEQGEMEEAEWAGGQICEILRGIPTLLLVDEIEQEQEQEENAVVQFIQKPVSLFEMMDRSLKLLSQVENRSGE